MRNKALQMMRTLNLIAEQVLETAPDENDCTSEENEVLAEVANFVNAFKQLPYAEAGPEVNTFHVTYAINARYVAKVKVPSNNIEDILEAAKEAYEDADFGELTDFVEAKPVIVENDSDIIWEA